MKALIATICVLFLSVNGIMAQTEKGKILLGGQSSMSFSSINYEQKSEYSSDDETVTKLEFSPKVGYFIADGFAVGTQLTFSTSKQKNDDDHSEHRSNSLAFVPFARYYFGSTNVKPYLHAGVGFGTAKTEFEVENNYYGFYSGEAKYNLSLYELGGGLAIFLNKSVAIDMGVGYSSTTTKLKDSDDDNKHIIKGLALNIGFTISL